MWLCEVLTFGDPRPNVAVKNNLVPPLYSFCMHIVGNLPYRDSVATIVQRRHPLVNLVSVVSGYALVQFVVDDFLRGEWVVVDHLVDRAELLRSLLDNLTSLRRCYHHELGRSALRGWPPPEMDFLAGVQCCSCNVIVSDVPEPTCLSQCVKRGQIHLGQLSLAQVKVQHTFGAVGVRPQFSP